MYGGKKIVALCCSKISELKTVELVNELNKQIQSYGYNLVVFHTCSDLYWNTRYEIGESAVFALIDYNIIDAVVILEKAFYNRRVIEKIVSDANDAGVPVVCIGKKIKNCINFRKDNKSAFGMVVRHMLDEHPTNKILMVAGIKGEEDSEERISAFKEELEKHHMPCNEELIIYGDYWSEPTKTSLEGIMLKGIKFDMVICANDSMAVTVCDVLHEYGYRVPEDIRISGFDGTEQAYYNRPMLTTGRFDMKAAIKEVGRVINAVLQGDAVEEEYSIPGKLIVAQSCGCDKKNTDSRFSIQDKDDLFHQYMTEDRLLQEMISRIQVCDEPREFMREFKSFQFKETMIMVNHSFFDESINPLDENNELLDNQMYALSDEISFDNENARPKLYTMKETMDKQFKNSETNPIVLSALSYNGAPFGLMIDYKKATLREYVRIPQQIQALNTALSSYRMVHHMQYMARNLEEISKRDGMTGMYNRYGFYQALSVIKGKIKKDEQIAVGICDMDGLKYINDNYGHNIGDKMIKKLADIVMQLPFRDKICARFGGDEFVFLFPVNDNSNCEYSVRKFLSEKINEYNEKTNDDYKLSASIGICIVSECDFQFDEVFKIADKIMYEEKKTKPHHR